MVLIYLVKKRYSFVDILISILLIKRCLKFNLNYNNNSFFLHFNAGQSWTRLLVFFAKNVLKKYVKKMKTGEI
jgi:hypothetical protein